jgi:photosystem II stability/assembly factor-like uncharacterized protein
VPTSVLPASPTPIVLPNVAQISAPSGSVVWVLVAGTRLFRSTDRGDTWQERPLPAQPVNPLISFIDDHEGWLAQTGSPGPQCQSQSISISHTADGGTTWPSLPATGIATSQCKNGITFIDGTRGFVMANAPGGAPLVYRTANGGQTWTASGPLANPPGFVTSPGTGLVVTAIRSFGTAALAGVAGPNAQYVYGSPDGGSTWTYASTAPNQLDPIAFVTATRWLQIGAPGASKETTDAGATWHAFVTDYQQAAPVTPAITFGDAQVGYATVRGAIQRTIDGGAHWTAIRTPGTF